MMSKCSNEQNKCFLKILGHYLVAAHYTHKKCIIFTKKIHNFYKKKCIIFP